MAIMNLPTDAVFDGFSALTANVTQRSTSAVSLSYVPGDKQAPLAIKLLGTFSASGQIEQLSSVSLGLSNGATADLNFQGVLGNSSFDVSGSSLRLDRLWTYLFADSDWFSLGDLADAVNLGGSDDFADAGGGDDRIQGGQGDDVLLGGSGNDTGIWTGSARGVRVQKLGSDHWRITDPTGAEGADSIQQIETLQFSDAVLSLANLPESGTPGYGINDRFLFDEVYYLLSHADLAANVTTAAAAGNYLDSGAAKGYAPNAWFGASYYKTKWADLTALNLDDATLFRHFNLYGVWEGRSPGAVFDQFDGGRYLTENPDVASYVDGHLGDFLGSRSNGALAHFLIYGSGEGRGAFNQAGQSIEMNYSVDLFAS